MAKNGKVGDKIKLKDGVVETISFSYTKKDVTKFITYEGSSVLYPNKSFVVL